MKNDGGAVESYPMTVHTIRVSPVESLTIAESGEAATFGMRVIQCGVTSVWGNIPLQHVVMLLEAAGYRVETPREASATKALLLEAADTFRTGPGENQPTFKRDLPERLRKAAER